MEHCKYQSISILFVETPSAFQAVSIRHVCLYVEFESSVAVQCLSEVAILGINMMDRNHFN